MLMEISIFLTQNIQPVRSDIFTFELFKQDNISVLMQAQAVMDSL